MMAQLGSETGYIVISPVKDEDRYLGATIQAVLRQTVRPLRWIIVDDGSRDNTPAILDRYRRHYPWITTLRIERDAKRDLGVAEIRAFAAGYQVVRTLPHDFVVKLDCDLELPQNYFEQLLLRFQQDETLGIASGIYLEKTGNRWVAIAMPEYHASGAAKMIRAKCFEDIGGFVLDRGWDTVDEIRAQVKGWKTRHFPELEFRHLRAEGSAIGLMRTGLLHGEVYHRTGGGMLFFLLKVLHRALFGKPILLSGFFMLLGYLKSSVSGRSALLNELETHFYRRLLNRRIFSKLAGLINGLKMKSKVWSPN